MGNRRQLLGDGLTVIGMVVLSLAGGWWASEYAFANSRRLAFDFSKPFQIPRNYEKILLRQSADTARFLIGDRVDILVQDGDSIKPLIIDAIVTNQTIRNTVMIVSFPHSGYLLRDAENKKLRLVFRNSIAPTAPDTFEHDRR